MGLKCQAKECSLSLPARSKAVTWTTHHGEQSGLCLARPGTYSEVAQIDSKGPKHIVAKVMERKTNVWHAEFMESIEFGSELEIEGEGGWSSG